MEKRPEIKKHPVLSALLWSGAFAMMGTLSATAEAGDESLFFASDIHDANDTVFHEIFYPKNDDSVYTCCETYALVGDYNSVEAGDYLSTTDDHENLMLQMSGSANRVLAGGNHDTDMNERDLITPSGLVTDVINFDGSLSPLVGATNYDLWVIDYLDFTNDQVITDLLDYFAQDTHQVLVILSHYPLHSTRNSDPSWITASRRLFLLLNAYGLGRDIIFVWGHNHRLTAFDAYVNPVAIPGETIRSGYPEPPVDDMLIDLVADQPLRFTYINAGYIKPGPLNPHYTIATVGDTDITVQRYLYVENDTDIVETEVQVPRKDLP